MDFIKYTFAIIVFTWAALTPELEKTPQAVSPYATAAVDTSFVDMVVTIDSLETTVDREVIKAKSKVVRNHNIIIKYAHKVDSLYETINQ